MNVLITNARLPGYTGEQQIQIDDRNRIRAIAPVGTDLPAIETGDGVLDVAGDWLSLGGVDLQINGALGLPFPEVTRDSLRKLAEIGRFLWQQGIDAYVPTIVTTSVENVRRSLAVIAEAMESNAQPHTAQILGVHLEGPFLNPKKRGAHPEEFLQPLSRSRVDELLEMHAAIVKIITLAPELDPSGEVISYLRSLGITISLGHSLVTAAQAELAFRQGASMVTHAFNAMPPLHHREPGLLGTALVTPGTWCGFIADGQHVCPTMLQLLLRAGESTQGLFLVSDALAPLGLGDGEYPWDSRQISVRDGTARLEDGTLAGTTLSLLAGAANLVRWNLCDPETAIALATETPRQAIALPSLAPGQVANFLRWKYNPDPCSLSWQRLLPELDNRDSK